MTSRARRSKLTESRHLDSPDSSRTRRAAYRAITVGTLGLGLLAAVTGTGAAEEPEGPATVDAVSASDQVAGDTSAAQAVAEPPADDPGSGAPATGDAIVRDTQADQQEPAQTDPAPLVAQVPEQPIQLDASVNSSVGDEQAVLDQVNQLIDQQEADPNQAMINEGPDSGGFDAVLESPSPTSDVERIIDDTAVQSVAGALNGINPNDVGQTVKVPDSQRQETAAEAAKAEVDGVVNTLANELVDAARGERSSPALDILRAAETVDTVISADSKPDPSPETRERQAEDLAVEIAKAANPDSLAADAFSLFLFAQRAQEVEAAQKAASEQVPLINEQGADIQLEQAPQEQAPVPAEQAPQPAVDVAPVEPEVGPQAPSDPLEEFNNGVSDAGDMLNPEVFQLQVEQSLDATPAGPESMTPAPSPEQAPQAEASVAPAPAPVAAAVEPAPASPVFAAAPVAAAVEPAPAPPVSATAPSTPAGPTPEQVQQARNEFAIQQTRRQAEAFNQQMNAERLAREKAQSDKVQAEATAKARADVERRNAQQAAANTAAFAEQQRQARELNERVAANRVTTVNNLERFQAPLRQSTSVSASIIK